jgi:hypothetical protein
MTLFHTNREAAWCCLRDASTLLGSETEESDINSPALQCAFRAGGLAVWQAKRTVAYVEANLGSNLAIGEMADLVALSKSHFARAQQHAELNVLAVSFAQGLQMTNILKDVWEDRNRGACWLPQEVFTRHGIDLAHLSAQHQRAEFAVALSDLVGIAHAHLRNALSYTLLIPGDEVGIRRFCLWAIGLAVLTLRNIERTPGFKSGKQVKVSHPGVAATRMLTSFVVRHDGLLKRLFDAAALDLPLASLPSMHEAPSAALETRAAGGWNLSSPADALEQYWKERDCS